LSILKFVILCYNFPAWYMGEKHIVCTIFCDAIVFWSMPFDILVLAQCFQNGIISISTLRQIVKRHKWMKLRDLMNFESWTILRFYFLSRWLIIMFSKLTTANCISKHQTNVMSANGTWISLSLQQFFYSPYINENLNWLVPKLNHMIWNRIIICILIWFPPSWIIMLQ
jgi:hypothetical protein